MHGENWESQYCQRFFFFLPLFNTSDILRFWNRSCAFGFKTTFLYWFVGDKCVILLPFFTESLHSAILSRCCVDINSNLQKWVWKGQNNEPSQHGLFLWYEKQSQASSARPRNDDFYSGDYCNLQWSYSLNTLYWMLFNSVNAVFPKSQCLTGAYKFQQMSLVN